MIAVEEKQRHARRPPDPEGIPTLVEPGVTFTSITEQISGHVLTKKAPLAWRLIFGFGLLLLFLFVIAVWDLLVTGTGIWGLNIPVAWGFAITNYVWWIEIAQGGTLLSAVLLVLNQGWRNSINRIAEAMTLGALTCAGLFPIIHLGRSWIAYWLFPYPNPIGVQPQFRSPLVWDVFAITSYATVSVLFWYFGLIPDLATIRDRAKTRFAQGVYGVLAMGWRGSSTQWRIHKIGSLLLAGLATPLVFSVHSVVSFDFSIAILPGWHSTIFPPYFVAGAIYCGITGVLIILIPMRAVYGLKNIITERHLNNCAKIMLTMSLILAFSYVFEPFTAWYSGDEFEMYNVYNKAFGSTSWTYWTMLGTVVVLPQLLWWRAFRVSPKRLFTLAIIALYGLWMERYVLMVTCLNRDYLPSSWANFVATFWDNITLYGSIGLFLVIFLLLIRYLPMVPIAEVRELLPYSKPGGGSEQ